MVAERKMKVFHYESPSPTQGKVNTTLARTDILTAAVQVITGGGETNLHAHSGQDSVWLVLNGRARFYEDESTVAGEIGRLEGIIIPRGVKYWFESASDEPLEILRVAGIAQIEEDQRVNYTPLLDRQQGMHDGSVNVYQQAN